MTEIARKYRKRPLTIEAVQLTDDADWDAIAAWCGGSVGGGRDHMDEGYSWVHLPVIGGAVYAYAGDWIIRGMEGEFHPCRHGIFLSTYEEQTDE